jgi:hypothetical protein
LNPLRTVGDAFDPTLPQFNALVRPANNEGISRLQLAELTNLEPMAPMRILSQAGLSDGVPVDDLTAAPEPPRRLHLSMEQIAGANIC